MRLSHQSAQTYRRYIDFGNDFCNELVSLKMDYSAVTKRYWYIILTRYAISLLFACICVLPRKHLHFWFMFLSWSYIISLHFIFSIMVKLLTCVKILACVYRITYTVAFVYVWWDDVFLQRHTLIFLCGFINIPVTVSLCGHVIYIPVTVIYSEHLSVNGRQRPEIAQHYP